MAKVEGSMHRILLGFFDIPGILRGKTEEFLPTLIPIL